MAIKDVQGHDIEVPMKEVDSWKDHIQNLMKFNYSNLSDSEFFKELYPRLQNQITAHLIQPEI